MDHHTLSRAGAPYALKTGRLSSHGRILACLRQLPQEARILDVGTATGYLGASLREEGFRRVWGLEYRRDWAEQAAPWYENVVVADLERDALPWVAGSFDAVICADILEHLRDPVRALQMLSALVAPEGQVLISVPNVAHWSMRASLLFGRFTYTDSGILDRTHLRFFTRASARQLLEMGALTIRQEAPIPLPIAHWCDGSRLSALWRVAEWVDGWLARICPSLFAYQFFFVGTPARGRRDAVQG